MTAKKAAKPTTRKPARTFDLTVSRGCATVSTANVPEAEIVRYLVAMTKGLREANRHCDELTPELTPLTGGGAIDTREDEWSHDSRRRVGFRE